MRDDQAGVEGLTDAVAGEVAHDPVAEPLGVGLDGAADHVHLSSGGDGLDAAGEGLSGAFDEESDLVPSLTDDEGGVRVAVHTVLIRGDVDVDDVAVLENGVVGEARDEVRLLVERTREALARGIKAVAPGRQVNVIGRTIESYAKRFGYGVVRDFTGHGVGEAFHSGLIIPHYDSAPVYDTVMEVGMVFTIEPMLTLGGTDWDMWADDWTVTTRDKSITAQFEHTLVVTERGAEILTLP
jgi:hypothetical protein